MNNLLHDVRYGLRVLLKSPGVTLVAILSLALGIGANTAIFSFVDQLLVRTLPVAEPERLVNVANRGPLGDEVVTNTSFSYPLYNDYRRQNEVLDGLAAYSPVALRLSEAGQSERLIGEIVSGNYFDVLGVKAALGRTFLPEEDQTEGTHAVVLLSHGFWQRRFGADPNTLNRDLELNGLGYRVIGILPPEFTGTTRGFAPDVYVPMMMQTQLMPRFADAVSQRNFTWLSVFGRLKAGVSRAQAQDALTALTAGIAAGDENAFPEIVLTDGSRGDTETVNTELSLPLTLMMATVGLVLLIACANVANLLLARATTRRKEIAVRLTLGASRARLIRQLLTESLLLALTGGALGLLVAVWLADVLTAFKPPIRTLNFESQLDWRVLGFSLLLTLLTGIIFGLAPAIQYSKPNLVTALKDETGVIGLGKPGWGRGRFTLRGALVVAQVAFSLIVLIGAGLCVRSLRNLQAIDVGFEPSKVLVMSLDLASNGYKEAQGREFHNQLLERVAALPGVEAASLGRIIPLANSGMRMSVDVEGYTPPPNQFINFDMNIVGADYFSTMKMPLVAGREFSAADTATSAKVVLVNETVERTYWQGESAIGKHIVLGSVGRGDRERLEIIGVVKDSRYRSVTEEYRPTMYLPSAQHYTADLALHVRAAVEPQALVGAVRGAVQTIDASLPVFGIRTLAEQKRNSLYAERMAATLLLGFGALALLLAAIGIYGVMAYAVTQRTREIGIRLAIGAEPRDVLRLVLKQGLGLVLAGVAVGLLGAFAVTRLLSSFLYGVSPTDPLTFAAVAIVLTIAALAACFIPARRATKVDPIVALRYE